MINVIVLLIICVLKKSLTYLDVRVTQNVTPEPNFFQRKAKKVTSNLGTILIFRELFVDVRL